MTEVWIVGRHDGSYSDYTYTVAYTVAAVCTTQEIARAIARANLETEIRDEVARRRAWYVDDVLEDAEARLIGAIQSGVVKDDDPYHVRGQFFRVRARDSLPAVAYVFDGLIYDYYPLTVIEDTDD